MENRLIIENLVVGEGAEAQDYNKVVVNYTGTLEDGSVFDSSLNPDREPFTFTLGSWRKRDEGRRKTKINHSF